MFPTRVGMNHGKSTKQRPFMKAKKINKKQVMKSLHHCGIYDQPTLTYQKNPQKSAGQGSRRK